MQIVVFVEQQMGITVSDEDLQINISHHQCTDKTYHVQKSSGRLNIYYA